MTNSDLIWKLVEQILNQNQQKTNDQNNQADD